MTLFCHFLSTIAYCTLINLIQIVCIRDNIEFDLHFIQHNILFIVIGTGEIRY